jgi:hypothetical protein
VNVSRVLRAKGAQADPQRDRPEEQHALLREESNQKQRDGGADESADDAVEALSQDQAALLWLRDDKHRQQRPLRLIEVEGESDQQRADAVVLAAKTILKPPVYRPPSDPAQGRQRRPWRRAGYR